MKQWWKSRKLWYTIIAGIVTMGCQIYKLYDPNFDADAVTKQVLYLVGMLLSSHVVSDVTNNIKK